MTIRERWMEKGAMMGLDKRGCEVFADLALERSDLDPALPLSVVVMGRRWVDTFGNTYHSAHLVVDGRLIGRFEGYGYGDQYEKTAFEAFLKEFPEAPRPERRMAPWTYFSKHGVRYQRGASDVARKRDL